MQIKSFRLNITFTSSSYRIQHRRRICLLVYPFVIMMFLSGCLNTEGIIEIKGTIIDEYSKLPIPGRKTIIQGLVDRYDNTPFPIDAGQFSTDSSGCFTHKLKKVKNAYSYNFCFVGDSNYASMTKNISLLYLEKNRKYLSFSLSKLVDFTIKINKIGKSQASLFMSCKSDEINCKDIFPYKIDNHGLTTGSDLIWIGVNVKSTIKTRVFADKLTTVRWVLYQNRNKLVIIDTITCKRGVTNEVSFKY